jgi:hypothetical protein
VRPDNRETRANLTRRFRWRDNTRRRRRLGHHGCGVRRFSGVEESGSSPEQPSTAGREVTSGAGGVGQVRAVRRRSWKRSEVGGDRTRPIDDERLTWPGRTVTVPEEGSATRGRRPLGATTAVHGQRSSGMARRHWWRPRRGAARLGEQRCSGRARRGERKQGLASSTSSNRG